MDTEDFEEQIHHEYMVTLVFVLACPGLLMRPAPASVWN